VVFAEQRPQPVGQAWSTALFVWQAEQNQSRVGDVRAPAPPTSSRGVHRLRSLLRARKAVKHKDPRKSEMLTSVPHPAGRTEMRELRRAEIAIPRTRDLRGW
jgi:hypothetical protein